MMFLWESLAAYSCPGFHFKGLRWEGADPPFFVPSYLKIQLVVLLGHSVVSYSKPEEWGRSQPTVFRSFLFSFSFLH